MDAIKTSIKCNNCQSTLSLPVLLPCGHVICKKHTEIAYEIKFCAKCGRTYSNPKQFVVIEPLSALISAQIESIDFGVMHRDASKSCDRLEKELNRMEKFFKEPKSFINETVESLKNQVELKREEFKLLIDESAENLKRNLDEYVSKCIEDLDSVGFKLITDEFAKIKNETREKLTKSASFLNDLKHDETRCEQIKLDCEQRFESLEVKLEIFKGSVLLNQTDFKRKNAELFCKTNLKQIFEQQ